MHEQDGTFWNGPLSTLASRFSRTLMFLTRRVSIESERMPDEYPHCCPDHAVRPLGPCGRVDVIGFLVARATTFGHGRWSLIA